MAGTGVANALALAAENAVPGDIDDDMAILVLRSSPDDLATAERTFPAEPIMVSEARRLAAATFASWGMDPDQADLACLLVSEVVTNAVLHACRDAKSCRAQVRHRARPARGHPRAGAGRGAQGPACGGRHRTGLG